MTSIPPIKRYTYGGVVKASQVHYDDKYVMARWESPNVRVVHMLWTEMELET